MKINNIKISARQRSNHLHTTLADSEVIRLAADGHFPQLSHSSILVEALRDILAR